MRLITLKLENFKGIKEFTLTADGRDVSVRGDNATGKTTLYDAMLWLLFDKDSLGQKQFEIKTLDDKGQVIHSLEHAVEGVFALDGDQLILRKVYKEKWTRKRGSAGQEMTGHTTDYWIDGVPAKASEYKARIAEIADEDLFRLLTSPTHFSEGLPWQRRREILLQVCGDITDADVIASDNELEPLLGIIAKRSLDDHRKVLQSRRTELNKSLELIPTRIDEASRSMPQVGIDVAVRAAQLDDELQQARKELEAQRAKLSRIESGGEIAEQQKLRAEKQGLVLGAENAMRAARNEAQSKHDARGRGLKNAHAEACERSQDLEAKIAHRERLVASLEAELVALRAEWTTENDKAFVPPSQPDTCPTCGQSIPQERIAAVKAESMASFSEAKALRLTDNMARGQAKKAEQDAAKTELVALRKEFEAAKQSAREALVAWQDHEASKLPPTPEPAGLASLRAELADIEVRISELRNGVEASTVPVRESIAKSEAAIAGLEEQRSEIKQWRNAKDRITELEAEQKRLAAEYETAERELYLSEQFVRAKVRMLEEHINSRFQLVRFKLFLEQINGGLSECCEMTVNGVPYGSLNRAARIQGGLDIINTLSEHHKFWPVVFIDNAESVTSLPTMQAQTITLYVDAAAKSLQQSTADQPMRNAA